MLTHDKIKVYIKKATNPRVGVYGENLVAGFLKSKGYDVKKVHKGGVDFFVEKFGYIDVKVIRKLNASPGSTFPRVSEKQEIDGVSYLYVVFWQNGVELRCEDRRNPVKPLSFKFSWKKTAEVLAEAHCGNLEKYEPSYLNAIFDEKKKLEDWITAEWKKTGRVIHREGQRTQNSMSGRRVWGPDNFYQNKTSKRRADIVVLLYFEREAVYEVFAYPVSHLDKIGWEDKAVGPNKTGKMTFDPLELGVIYKFKDVEEFKTQFSARFRA